jgi:Isochorismatase family
MTRCPCRRANPSPVRCSARRSIASRTSLKPGRSTLLIAGVATEIIVQHSALSGAAHGFHVQVVIDACSGLSPRTEDAALRRLTLAGIVTTSLPSIAGQLAGDFTQTKDSQALGILYEMASG